MEVTIRQEAGYDLSLYGMSLSFKDEAISPEDWWRFGHEDSGLISSLDRKDKMKRVAEGNANRGMGHNKFRRQIMLWIDIKMCRAWWPEMDQYKIATVTQSGSTVHTLSKRPLTLSDCEEGTSIESIEAFNKYFPYKTVRDAKLNLPEGYLQRKLLTCNYETLSNIIIQRRGHRMKEWDFFIDTIYATCEHPELLP